MNRNFKILVLIALTACSSVIFSCRKDLEPIIDEQQGEEQSTVDVTGLYLLNEGNYGSNKASLDYYNYATGVYTRDIFGAANPEVTLGLGDTGNDIKIYGSKIYLVINGSNKLEILDGKTAKRVGKVDIPNCRYVAFNKNFAYVTSYEGYVAVIDTTALSTIQTKITVGNQPDELAVVGSKLYVANSGGYNYPDYNREVSVIDLNTNKEIKKIDVAINLHRLKADKYGDLYVSSRGNYEDIPSNLYVIDTKTDAVKKVFNIPVSNFWINGDDAYIYSYNNSSQASAYIKINVENETILSNNFISDGTDSQISVPYGVAVDPFSGFIYVTDAKDYGSPGTLYCFDTSGKKKFSLITGDIPAHIAFVTK